MLAQEIQRIPDVRLGMPDLENQAAWGVLGRVCTDLEIDLPDATVMSVDVFNEERKLVPTEIPVLEGPGVFDICGRLREIMADPEVSDEARIAARGLLKNRISLLRAA